jgi:hypothetical protein
MMITATPRPAGVSFRAKREISGHNEISLRCARRNDEKSGFIFKMETEYDHGHAGRTQANKPGQNKTCSKNGQRSVGRLFHG